MPSIDLSILNQRQTPAFYADTLANRPAAGFVGRIFVSTNTFAFFRDNGTGWDLIGGPGTGTVTGTGTSGQVTYWNGASTITGSNDLFFDAVNGHLGIGTITPGTALDVKHDQNTVVQLEQITATNDNRIAFITSGVGLWRLGAFYNAGANDFGLFDIASATQPVTVKRTTGQVLIGTSTVGSGKLVVASATGDNGVQIVGATAPSLRIDNAESGPTKRAGLGISTATNNFIQGSADRNFCMFNGSTTASPILFGIYDTTNVQEAARISAARNFIINSQTDNGQRLQVNGTAGFAGAIGNTLTKSGSGVESQNFFNLRLAGTNAIGDSQNINFLNDGFQTISRISGVIGDDNVAYGSLAFTTRNFFSDTLVEVMRITNKGSVGFGVTTPTTKTTIKGLSTDIVTISSTSTIQRISNFIPSNDIGNLTIGVDTVTGNSYLLSFYNGSDLIFATRNGGSNSEALRIKANGVINIKSIPTSAAGLSSGDIYSNLGVLTIVP